MYYRQPQPLEPYDPEKKYTPSQLDQYATQLLKDDRKVNKDSGGHRILFEDQLNKYRYREICVDATTIDGTLTNIMQDPNKPGVTKGDGMKIFGRHHPLGRKVNSKEARAKGASHYKS